MTRRRRGRLVDWPPRLARFAEAQWPQPDIGPDAGATGLRDPDCGRFLARIAEEYGDPGLVAAWRTTFAHKRWVQARLDFLGEDHPAWIDEWIDGTSASGMIVQRYAAERDWKRRREPG